MVANHTVSIRQVFVTGSTGLVGNALVEELLAQQIGVTALVRSESSPAIPPGVQLVTGGLSDLSLFSGIISKCDAVLHLAAKTPGSSGSDSEFEITNIEGTANVIEECVRAGKRLVYVSTVNVELFRQGRVQDRYSESKSIAEQYVTDAMNEGLDAVIIRASYVFGNVPGKAGALVDRIFSGRIYILPASDRVFCPVFAGDLAKAIVLAARTGTGGSTNIIAGECTSLKEFVNRVCALTGRAPARATIPIWMATVPLSVMWALRPLTHWTPPLTVGALRTKAVFDGAPAGAVLGFEYRTIEELFQIQNSDLEFNGSQLK
jgi:dihydroflavonol-4-reductase